MTQVTVHIPAALRGFADGASELPVEAGSVREALQRVGERHQLLVARILTRGGALRPYVNIFLDERDIRGLDGLDTAIDGARELLVVPSVAGG